MKTKRIKAELIESAPNGVGAFSYEYILPADAESYERMVEQMAEALHATWSSDRWSILLDAEKNDSRKEARAALCAIGITQPKKGTK